MLSKGSLIVVLWLLRAFCSCGVSHFVSLGQGPPSSDRHSEVSSTVLQVWQWAVGKSTFVSGINKFFKLFALPNPLDLHHPDFDRNSLVPVLIGMDHLGSKERGMSIDFQLDWLWTHHLSMTVPRYTRFHPIRRVTMFWTLCITSLMASTVLMVMQ